MVEKKSRSLDACGPRFLDEHARGEAPPSCGRGVCVETPFDLAVAEGEIGLSLRRAEWHEGGPATVEIERVFVTISLSTGRCAPRDASADRFLAEHPWIPDALVPHLDWLRSRERRRAAQRDRSPCFAALDRAAPGDMIPYDALFPSDWDLLFRHDGRTYWALDQHCSNAACPCGEILLTLYDLDAAQTERGGDVRIDFTARRPKPKASSPLATRLIEPLWARHAEELSRRHREVRRAMSAHATARALSPSAIGGPPLPPRNAPCPCGSGKKFKRCCADPSNLDARRSALASR